MKHTVKKMMAIGLIFATLTPTAQALEGEMGYFGGISTGVKLPTITELSQDKKQNKTSSKTLPYKETLYLTGVPVVVEGTISVKPNIMDKTKPEGTYTESYVIKASDAEGKNKVTRNITLETTYIYEANRKQTTKTSTLKKWTENMIIGGKTYQLDQKLSHFSKSMLEEHTPGATYYRGDIQYDAVYKAVGGKNLITMSVNGPIYGYDQAFAKSETQKRSITITSEAEQFYIEETPTVTVYKDIQYGSNEPTAISMAGNYKELIRGSGAHAYQVIQGSPSLYDNELTGSTSLESAPVIEQLSIPNLPQIKGHPAESDVKRMYSMKIFDDNGANFAPNQVVRKKEYIAMLVRALQIPLPEEDSKTSKKKEERPNPFWDIKTTDPYYPYAVAAYDAGLVGGGQFSPEASMTRELVYMYNISAIGLERLGIGTMGMYTPFMDDREISPWAKAPLYAAARLGIIEGANGYIFPKKKITKVEAATFMNQLINYLRYDLQKDYNAKMMM